MKLKPFLLAASSGLALLANATAQSDPSLVLHYRFDQPGDEVEDLSGHNNNGTIVDGEYLDEFQGRKGVLRLNGTSAYVNCGKGKSLQLNGDTTFEMWIRQNGELLNKWSVIFGDDPSKGLNLSIAHHYSLDFFYRGPDFNGAEMIANPVPRDIISKEWSHIAIVVEYPRLRFYCNGKLVRDAFMPIRGLSTKAQGTLKRIGGKEGAGTGSFAPIDLTEFRIYSRALAADEIARNAAGEGAGPIEASELAVEPNWYKDELTVRLVRKNIPAMEKDAEFVLFEDGAEVGKIMGSFEKVSENDSARFAATAVFPLRELEGKTLKVMARTETGDSISQEIVVNAPDWIREQAGKTTEVLPPWTPVQVERNGKKLSLKVWGRSYEFGPLLLPRQIESAGKPLFTKPVTLEARANGKTLQWTAGPIEVKEQTDASVRLEQTLTAGPLTLNVGARLEFDGYLIYDLDLTASADTQLDGLGLLVSFIPDKALFGYGDRVFPRESPKNVISEWFSGEIVDQLNFRFSANVWIGADERGLTWQAESNEFWNNADPQKAMVITPEKESTTLQINFVDAARTLKPREPLSYRFAFLATPIKPLRRDAWDFRIARYEPWGKEIEMGQRKTPDGTPEAKSIVDLGVRHLFTNITDVWPWPMPVGKDFAKATHGMVEAAHKYGLKLHNYGIHQRVPVNVPEFDIYGSDMSNRPLKQYVQPLGQNQERPGPISLKLGADSQATVMMCPKSEALQDAYLYALDQRLKTFGDDGVYLDGTASFVPCMNTEHGCGYLGADGVLKPTYPVFAVRELMKRLNSIVKSHDPDAIIDAHSSFCYNLAGLAYADVMWTGEQWHHLRDTGTNYVSGQLTLDKFRTEFTGRQIGIGAETLHYRLRDPMKVAATSLLHDISPRYSLQAFDNITGKPDPYFALMPKLWKLRDEFGANEAEKLYYYNNQDYVTVAGEQGHATLLKHPSNGTLALVSNLSREKQDLTVSFNLQSLGLRAGEVSVIDPLTGKDVPISAEGKVTLSLESEAWEYLWLKPAEAKKLGANTSSR